MSSAKCTCRRSPPASPLGEPFSGRSSIGTSQNQWMEHNEPPHNEVFDKDIKTGIDRSYGCIRFIASNASATRSWSCADNCQTGTSFPDFVTRTVHDGPLEVAAINTRSTSSPSIGGKRREICGRVKVPKAFRRLTWPAGTVTSAVYVAVSKLPLGTAAAVTVVGVPVRGSSFTVKVEGKGVLATVRMTGTGLVVPPGSTTSALV